MIEKAKAEHLDAIMKIWLETNILAHPFIPKTYWEKAFEQVKQAMPTADLFICHEDSVVKGFIGITGNNYIAGLFIDEAFQSQGIGRELIDYCKQKYHRLELDVFVENTGAVRFYQSNGFEITETKIAVDFNHKEHHMVWCQE